MTQVKSNNIYENINYSLKISRWTLKSIGAWPLTDTWSVIEKIAVFVQFAICSSSVTIVTVPCIFYFLLEDVSFESKLNAMGPVVNRIMGSICYWMLIKKRNEIRGCISHMEMDWRLIEQPMDREVMLQYAKLGHFISSISAMIMQSGQLLFGTARAIKTVEIIVDNQTFRTHPMTCPAYSKIIDTRFSPTNEIILVIQFLSAFVLCSAVVSVCSLAAVFAMHACGQLNVLHAWLKNLIKKYEKENHSVDKKLAIIVKHHLRALRFIARIENMMHKICFVMMVGCTLNMCFLGYYMIMNLRAFDAAKIISYIVLFISFSFNIFIFCYIGEMLTEQCRNVGNMVYMADWYQLPYKSTLCLMLIIIRSNYVIKITAGKLVNLSIATFGDVIKTSMTYLNLLRTLTM